MHDDFLDLARGPSRMVVQYRGYLVNGYRFHTESYGVNKGTSNSGVCVRETVAGRGASDFYDILEDVIEVQFTRQSVVLFRCRWFDTTSERGVWMHPQHGLVEVNPKKEYPYPEPFVLSRQAIQVYYAPISNPRRGHKRKNWWAVFPTRARHVIDGLTNLSAPPTRLDDESDVQATGADFFQDNNIPPLAHPEPSVDMFDKGVPLHTGNYVEVPGHHAPDPAPPPSMDDLMNLDDEPEQHDSD